ncbi:hypothetical protein NLX67_05645 [Domibacillus sp. A3M-37]|uniref:hypothetical protein n=1 Tax=Domibacillus TaxID=1433999 RepID=UPI00061817CD|nr:MULTISPECIES: hypothetical protein [Domibacillus]MCP3761867.1 hypothetical protein [Domibacillus sp. A3M-37]
MALIKPVLQTGAVTGLFLGFFLKGIELFTGKGVYTLLLNVDFIPIINQVLWPEWIEFFFHLLVSLLIAAGFFLLLPKTKRPYSTAFLLTLPAIFLYFPLSALACKSVPEMDDMRAFFWWTAGHILYALILGLYGQKFKREA